MEPMTYTFPPDPRPEWLIVAVHAVLGVMSIGSVVLLIRRTCRPPVPIDFLKWFGLMSVAWLLALQLSVRQYESQPALVMAMITSGVGTLAFLITSVRIAVRGKPEDKFAAIGCPILLFGAILWFSSPGMGSHVSDRSMCKNNLKQIGLALFQALDETGSYPAAVSSEPVPRSWRVDLLPWIDQAPLRTHYDDESTWDSSKNEQWARLEIPGYACPANFNPADSKGRRYTAYAAVAGAGTIYEPGRSRKLSEVTDGTSNTLQVIEACGREIIWTEPRDIDINRDPVGLNLNGSAKTQSPGWGSSYHRDGCNVLMGDGAVRFLSNSIDPTVLKSIATAAGGEDVDDF
jgi:prepilin-type processing-associated H-X9-DG protein